MSGPGVVVKTHPGDVVYQYDGSLDGFFCCVFASVYEHELPLDIQREGQPQMSLLPCRQIITDPAKAKRVRVSIPTKIGKETLELIEIVFLSCMEQKEMAMLRFLLLGYEKGKKTLSLLGHPLVAPLLAARRHLLHENHLLLGFIRFSDYGSGLAAVITPKNFVLPFMAQHFISRYYQENFLIYDRTHKAALVWQDQQKSIIPLEDIVFPDVSETEAQYRALWRRFFQTIAIEARTNPRCQMTQMPKRYWENMLEMQPEQVAEKALPMQEGKKTLPLAEKHGLLE